MKKSTKLLSTMTLGIAALAYAASDTVGLTGNIPQSVTIDIANSTTPVTMTSGTETSEAISVSANVPFSITVDSTNNLKMKNATLDEVNYTFTIKDASSATIISTEGIANHNEVAETWTFNITPTGIDGATDAGTYTDTVTITVSAQ